MADNTSLPRPMTTGELFLAAILDELRAIRKERSSQYRELPTSDTHPDSDRLREGKRKGKL